LMQALRKFREEFLMHTNEKKCSTNVCDMVCEGES